MSFCCYGFHVLVLAALMLCSSVVVIATAAVMQEGWHWLEHSLLPRAEQSQLLLALASN